MKILENIAISELTTMRLGGKAKFVIDIEQEADIAEAYDFARQRDLPVFILGDGANTIGRDKGFDGVIIRNKMHGIEVNSKRIVAMGGEEWDKVVEISCEFGLTGIEALSKIPGTAGAAPVQNIGAYGQEIAQVLQSIRVFDTRDNTIKTLKHDELAFSYRKSILNSTESGRYLVVAIELKLRRGEMLRPFYKSIEDYIEKNRVTDFSPNSIRQIVSEIRAIKLPDPKHIASSGSFFKNVYLDDAGVAAAIERGIPVYQKPGENKINSGWLISQVGLAGKLIHGMRVSDKASLVLINESAKGYADLAAARSEIIDTVKQQFGFTLEQEPVEIV